MDDHWHFNDGSVVEDDHDVLFGPAGDHAAREGGEAARVWRLYTAGDGYEGVSTAMTLEGAREFAALREEGITVLWLESAAAEVLDGHDAACWNGDATAQAGAALRPAGL